MVIPFLKRVVLFAFSPLVLALWTTILLLVIFPIRFPKYIGKTVKSEKTINDVIHHYVDIDKDGESEDILTFHNSIGKAGVTVNKNGGAIEQWNLYGTFNFIQREGTIITGDRDNNGTKEIYIFTISNDSIFLSSIDNIYNSKLTSAKKFIAKCGIAKGRVDVYIISARMENTSNSKDKELIFGITSGFSLYPRQVFAYNFEKNTILTSPSSRFFIQDLVQGDIDGNGKNEIILCGYAASNVHDSTVKYHDRSSWLMVLDQKLNFLFDPIEFKGQYSSVKPFLIKGSGKPRLMVLYTPPYSTNDSSRLFELNENHKLLLKSKFSPKTSDALVIQDNNGAEFILIKQYQESISLYDTSLRCKKIVSIEGDFFLQSLDLDLDGNNEIIVSQTSKRKLIVYRHDLSHPVEFNFDGNGEQGIIYSIIQHKNAPPQLFFQFGQNCYTYQYGLNPNYLYRYLVYLLIYSVILGFILVIRKVQQIQIQRKLKIEKKISELQLQIVRNQIDPHFSMNAVNSIIASIENENKEELKQHLLNYSKLHRSLLLSTDKIERSLGDELDFVKNYLELEKVRFKEKLDYQVELENVLSLEHKIPKMLIQIHAENAVKHGLRHKSEKGIIAIRCKYSNDNLVVEIEDNGVGREYTAMQPRESTGKGLEAIDHLSELYGNLTKTKISTNLIDLFDNSGKPAGTLVRILIPAKHEN